MDLKGGVHDLFGDGVFRHGGCLIVSRQDAKTPRTQKAAKRTDSLPSLIQCCAGAADFYLRYLSMSQPLASQKFCAAAIYCVQFEATPLRALSISIPCKILIAR